jgi:hypothetical protein
MFLKQVLKIQITFGSIIFIAHLKSAVQQMGFCKYFHHFFLAQHMFGTIITRRQRKKHNKQKERKDFI